MRARSARPNHVDSTRILPGLHQGSRPPQGGELQARGVDVLVLCALEYQPFDAYFPGVKVLRVRLDDSGVPMSEREWEDAQVISLDVAMLVAQGKRVLVTCQQGRNRSGLVVALTMHRLTGQSGAACVRHIQRLRHKALENEWFVAALERLPRRGQRRRLPEPRA